MKYIFIIMMLMNFRSYSFTVRVTGIEERDAPIYMAVFETDEGFPYEVEKGSFIWGGTPAEAEKGVEAGLEKGSYAVVIFQDMNGNGVIDRWFWGKPKEPYGVSKAIKKPRRRPKFQDGVVTVDSDSVIKVRLWNP
ncbi:DUF2141 domain-containing protein [uncultured Ilyobacter sp.]|uniref:DUF2141 domain-containing protein n=1 Tax=uncultured Ilyobacter sp. TaxID=544433 RepID=UPI0029F54E1D|nr:DUF2141 domain-containing protein [uncultured Ilyobacter sp.]